MPSYTTSLRLIQPATGEYSGSWGTQVNNGITALVDTSVAGTASITMTAADYTLSTANGATDEARAMFLVLGGTPGAARNVICPAVSKLYYVTNNTTGGFAQTVKTASGTGISVPNGASMVLRCDGTNVVEALNAFGSLTINTGKVVLPNTQSYAIKANSGASCDVVTLTSGNVLELGGGGATDSIQFWNQGLQRMTLDSSGNLGLGVTPSAWSSVKALQIAGSSAISSTDSTLDINTNAYYNSGYKYITSSQAAAQYVQTAGTHRWFTAPSGTAGNAITFTQAMTLDASGNLGVGTNSPGARLETVASGSAIYFSGGDSAGARRLQFNATTTTNTGDTQNINALGSTGVLAFSTNSSERARITSGGDLLVGTTNASATTGVGVKTISSGSVYAVGATSDYFSGYNSSVSAFRFYVSIAGTISATNTTISAISDQRLKENIRDIDVGLDKIMALKPRKFDWKAGKGQDKKDVRGFIAQEFEQVFPDLIDEWKDPAPEGEEPYKAVRADLIPVLVKAIQEQQAIIEDLRARVAALEQA